MSVEGVSKTSGSFFFNRFAKGFYISLMAINYRIFIAAFSVTSDIDHRINIIDNELQNSPFLNILVYPALASIFAYSLAKSGGLLFRLLGSMFYRIEDLIDRRDARFYDFHHRFYRSYRQSIDAMKTTWPLVSNWGYIKSHCSGISPENWGKMDSGIANLSNFHTLFESNTIDKLIKEVEERTNYFYSKHQHFSRHLSIKKEKADYLEENED